MSRKQLIHILDDAKLLQIEKDLTINIDKGNKYSYGAKKEVILYDRYEDDVIVPFSYDSDFIRTERKSLPQMNVEFEGKLRENQITVKSEAINFLNKHGSVIISAGCGFGKTSTSIFIATVIKLKTLVICNRIILMNQWKDAILKFCPQAKVQILKPKDKLNEDSDFYIINACNICKFSSLFFKTIGTVICDELHIIMAEKISSCMKFLFPRYLIGLSATPYRHDGLDSLIELYFGKNKIVRKLFREHVVYKYSTGYKPEVKINSMGKVDWSSVIDSISNNEERNEDIISIVKQFKNRTFLIPCKRVVQAEFLLQRLKDEGEYVTSLIGKNQEFDSKARVLIGTVQKCSVGFDHAGLDALIIGSDIEQYFEQLLGRVFRTETVIPIIFDLVDDFGLLYKHYKTRHTVYLEHGGKIKNFLTEFPNFK